MDEDVDDDDDETNIWTLCSDGKIDKVSELIRNGISVNCQDENGYSPM